MDPCARMPGSPDRAGPADREAAEFVSFCRDRRRVGWPELYDEMWVVANRRLFRGYGFAELGELGIGFSLFETRRLAAIVAAVIADEPLAARRGASIARRGVAIAASPDEIAPVPA
jgi:hypothetical protein